MTSLESFTLTADDTEYTSTFNGEDDAFLFIEQHLPLTQQSESLSSSIQLSEYLSSYSLDSTFKYLQELDLCDIRTFYDMTEKDLEGLCSQISSLHNADFDFIQKLKFKAAIRSLQRSQRSQRPNTPSHSQSHSLNDIITITPTERECMENVENTIKKIDHIQTFYEQYSMNDIEQNVNNIKQRIKSKFKCIIKALNKTQHKLLNTV